jgi:hypothetical protein
MPRPPVLRPRQPHNRNQREVLTKPNREWVMCEAHQDAAVADGLDRFILNQS